MGDQVEAKLRDELANLSLLEAGLQLVDIEEYLPNAHGTRGFIDILARDRLSNLVIIELKRAEGAAREAIHELYKYLALMRQNHGIAPERMRCIIVSTVWRELLVPFSEMKRNAPFEVEGRQLYTDVNGKPIRSEIVTPLAEAPVFELCPEHWMVACEFEAGRASVVTRIEEMLSGAGIEDYVVFLIDYKGGNPRVIYPFLYYFVPGRIPEPDRSRLLAQNALEIAEYEDPDHPDWLVEEAIVSYLHVAVDLEVSTRELDIGSPEKLAGLLNDGWEVRQVLRPGRLLRSPKIFPDDEVVHSAQGRSGQNRVYYSAIVSPRFKHRWGRISHEVSESLKGNSYWLRGLEAYLAEVVDRWPDSTVSLNIYNPLDCLSYLVKTLETGDSRYLPEIQVFVDNTGTTGQGSRLLIGQWAYAGRRMLRPRQIVNGLFGGIQNYGLHHQFHTICEHEDRVMRALGLRYQLVEVTFASSGEPDARQRPRGSRGGGCAPTGRRGRPRTAERRSPG